MNRAPCSVGVVAIGRNEGARLAQCLRSVLVAGVPVVYVDSGSGDHSVASAKALGVNVIELDRSSPFSAARARNEGFDFLLDRWPSVEFVQFIDGDCTLAPGWLRQAAAWLRADPRQGAVIGHLREKEPKRSVYNLLCAIEWRSAPGPVSDFGAFGGISMIRSAVFREIGGFDTRVIAGEDSELAVRMALAGYGATKLPAEMAEHDARMTRLSQWWKRSVRSGHAIAQRADLNGATTARDGVRARKSVLWWALGLPLAALSLAGLLGASALLVLPVGYLALGVRIRRHRRRVGDLRHEATVYAFFTTLAKFAQLVGLARYSWNKARSRFEIIEYK